MAGAAFFNKSKFTKINLCIIPISSHGAQFQEALLLGLHSSCVSIKEYVLNVKEKNF